jgi:hypothetical protein
LKFHQLLPRESANLGFNHFELAHDATLPKQKRQFKRPILPPAPTKLRRNGMQAALALHTPLLRSLALSRRDRLL